MLQLKKGESACVGPKPSYANADIFITQHNVEIYVENLTRLMGYSLFPSAVIDEGSWYHHPNISVHVCVFCSAGGQ